MRRFVLIIGAAVGIVQTLATADEPAPKSVNGLPLLFHDSFESPGTDQWEFTDTAAWKIDRVDGNGILSQFKRRSDYEPPVRSPFNRAILKELKPGNMVLDVKVQSTIPDYNHRDMCLFFGYQDESHFYYVHLGKRADDHANQIFIVNGKPRVKISTSTTAGTNWTDDWHHARVVRNTASGKIEVFFDDMTKPVMTAVDKTFGAGRVGVGSFDDTGNFDDVRVYAE